VGQELHHFPHYLHLRLLLLEKGFDLYKHLNLLENLVQLYLVLFLQDQLILSVKGHHLVARLYLIQRHFLQLLLQVNLYLKFRLLNYLMDLLDYTELKVMPNIMGHLQME